MTFLTVKLFVVLYLFIGLRISFDAVTKHGVKYVYIPLVFIIWPLFSLLKLCGVIK